MNAILLVLVVGHFSDRPDPSSAYEVRTVEGFRVLVHPRVLEHAADAAAVMTELRSQLKAIAQVVPEKPLADLRTVPIWIEWEARPHGAAEFHRSADWLKENGYNVEKVGAVEIANARNFVAWSRQNQPWMVMHELAHAYHHRILKPDHAGIADAFRLAVASGRLTSVAYGKEGKRKAYALTDSYEYFAEMTEAYFGRNDFAPFDRAELKTFDPVAFRLMREVWGDPAS